MLTGSKQEENTMRKLPLYAMTAAATLTMLGAGSLTSYAAVKSMGVKTVYAGNFAVSGKNMEELKNYLNDCGQTIIGIPGGIVIGGFQPDVNFPDMILPDIEIPDTDMPDWDQPDQDASDNTSYIKQVVNLVNAERTKAGLKPLSASAGLEKAAAVRQKEIQRSFSHTRPDGKDFSTVLKESGISYQTAGENIAYGQRNPKEVVDGWMNSAGHRANILNANFGSIGVGYGQDSNGTPYWVQLFTN